jgi:hypothetical protein
MAARLLQDYAGDRQMFLQLLALALQDALGERLKVKRGGGWLARSRPVESIEVELDDDRYALAVGRGGKLAATRTRVVRGIDLRTDEMSVENWLTALSEALFRYGQQHAESLEALRRRLW